MGLDGNRDLVLAPGEFAYVLDTTKGLVNVNVGPYKTSMAGTDQPVIFDKRTMRFVRCQTLEESIQRDFVAPEGFYLALYNPAEGTNNEHPVVGKSSVSADLNIGHRINVHGPAHFALWPGQMVDVIRGHHLRSNQYLLAQVYNDSAATANWQKAVVKPQGQDPVTPIAPQTFAPGATMVIKGTEVAFFMPPTGIKVIPESAGIFVREAVTLERLEYCILLDEQGDKRFIKGPDVVFPEPTETFVMSKEGSRKFRAIELNETTGIYVKVIADYVDDETHIQHKTGDELFITGKEQAIYFQREEHSVIRYGEQTKHYAVAVPAGEGRYVLNRQTGVIDLVRGPKMLLCDPRTEVIVRRVLAHKTAALWYPNNATVLSVNKALEDANRREDSSQYQAGRSTSGGSYSLTSSNYMALNAMDEVAASSRQLAGDTFTRGTAFTPPRTLTLDTKYEGAVSVNVWAGYAVLVVSKTGKRRVEVGPKTLLLEYDETLAPLGLSTGTPKTRNRLLDTVYLRVRNNTVSDVIAVETSDLVRVEVKVSYRVNFEGDNTDQWFNVENYIGLLCDHLRSKIRNTVKRQGIEKFYSEAIDVVRDTVLGPAVEAGRPGITFAENGMHVYDVEVLDVSIVDEDIDSLLGNVQSEALRGALAIAQEERQLEILKRSEAVKREMATEKAASATLIATSTKEELTATLATGLLRVQNEARLEQERLDGQIADLDRKNTLNAASIARTQAVSAADFADKKRDSDLFVERMLKETEELVKRADAMDENVAAVLTAFSDKQLVEKVSTALAPMAAYSGISAMEIMAKLLGDTPFASTLKQLSERTQLPIAKK